MIPSNIQDKIDRLRSMTVVNGCSLFEAELACKKIQSLMIKYDQLTDDELLGQWVARAKSNTAALDVVDASVQPQATVKRSLWESVIDFLNPNYN